jgi:hypothetical protein
MLFGRNLIALNHFAKTGGSSIIQMLIQAHPDRLITPFRYDSQSGMYDYSKFEDLKTQVKADPSNFVYTHFHPGDVARNREIVDFLQNHAILMCVFRRPSDIFESLVRYYYQVSQQDPVYFKKYLESKFIISSNDPNFILDLCLMKIDQEEMEDIKNPAASLMGYIVNILPPVRDFSVFSRNLNNFFSQDIVYFDSKEILEIAKKDYFAICTIEQLDDLIKFLKFHAILPHDMELPHVNRSQDVDKSSISLTDDRKNKIDVELNPFGFSIWQHLIQYGPLFQNDLINPDVVIF